MSVVHLFKPWVFRNLRFEQVLKIKSQEEKTIIQDRTIYEDAYIFAQNLYESGHLNETDFQTYRGLFNTIMRAISPPDLMIYLKADIPKLVNQIKKRGRDYEESIDPNYLKSLNLLYKKFSEQYKHSKLIEIDVNDMDFVQNQDDFISITKSIEKSINLGKQLKIRKED